MSEVNALPCRIKIKPFVMPIVLMVICILNIESVISGVKHALNVCAVSIIPSLFVFMVLSDITVTLLTEDDTVALPPKITAFVIGSLCGFPIGASICEKLYIHNEIGKDDAAKIIPFCNNASPAFVIGAIGVSMLNNKQLGLLLYFSQILASLLPLLFIKVKAWDGKKAKSNHSISEIFFSSIEKSILSILKVCAVICIFSVVIALLKSVSLEYLSVFLEISNGTAFCASLANKTPTLAIALCGFCCGFSGICVHLQIFSSLKSVKVKYYKLLFCKVLQGFLSSIFTLIGYYLFF
ncbi:MAG: hypothetical protein IJ002_05770 [Clostridia bacterium]|nr:hypothetical protein [Clostridia bacterium]